MSAIVAGMYRDMLEAIKLKENSSIRKVISGRDDEVDRQIFFACQADPKRYDGPKISR